jgi:hypothetical protein
MIFAIAAVSIPYILAGGGILIGGTALICRKIFKSEIDNIKTGITNIKTDIDNIKTENMRLIDENERLRKLSDTTTAERNQLRDKLTAINEEKLTLWKELTATRGVNNDLRERVGVLEKEKANYESQIQQKDRKIAELQKTPPTSTFGTERTMKNGHRLYQPNLSPSRSSAPRSILNDHDQTHSSSWFSRRRG